MHRRLLVAVALTATLALGGCTDAGIGSSDGTAAVNGRVPSPTESPNGLEDASAGEILDASLTAAKKATSVRITGRFTEHGEPLSFDLTLVKGVGSKGVLETSDGRFSFITVHGKAYIKGNRRFLRSATGDKAAADLLGGRWVRAQGFLTGEGAAVFNAKFSTVFHELGLDAKAYKGREAYVDRHRAIGLVNRVDRSTVWVSLDGTPYPLRAVPHGKKKASESVAFSDWNAAVVIKAPQHPLRMSDLR